jgi:hypothetical protein
MHPLKCSPPVLRVTNTPALVLRLSVSEDVSSSEFINGSLLLLRLSSMDFLAIFRIIDFSSSVKSKYLILTASAFAILI